MATTTQEELHRLIDGMDEVDAEEALDYLRWMLSDQPETLTAEELAEVEAGEAAIARGEFLTLDDLKHELGR